MIVRLLTDHNLEFLCLKGGCTVSYESTHVKMPYCWKAHVTAHFCLQRVLCKGSTILIALKKDVPSITWKVGQLVIGSDKWQCSNNANNPDSKTIYTKVEEVKHPKEHVIELHSTSAG